MAFGLPLEVLNANWQELRRRELRLWQLKVQHGIKLPTSLFTTESTLRWMSENNQDQHRELLEEATEFFEPLKDGSLLERSTCTYKQVAARVIAYHEHPLQTVFRETNPEDGFPEEVTTTEHYSGLDEDLYDQEKFPQSIRWSWLTEAAEVALQASGQQVKNPTIVGHFAGLIWDRAQIDIRSVVRGERNTAHDPSFQGFKFGQFEGVDCASITLAVRDLFNLPDFKFCPIGKFGGSPSRDRWQHCPSVCAERGALAEWHKVLAERLIKEPQWRPTSRLAIFTTAIPCYFCAMGISHEPGLQFVVIGSIKQRPGQPYLNADDQISLDILAQNIGLRGGAVLFYDSEGIDEYLSWSKANQILP